MSSVNIFGRVVDEPALAVAVGDANASLKELLALHEKIMHNRAKITSIVNALPIEKQAEYHWKKEEMNTAKKHSDRQFEELGPVFDSVYVDLSLRHLEATVKGTPIPEAETEFLELYYAYQRFRNLPDPSAE